MTSKLKGLFASALEWAKGEAQASLLSFALSLDPAPASRPRVSRFGGVYYGKNYERFRVEAGPQALSFDGVPTDQPIVVLMEMVVRKPARGKLQIPKGDVDNYAKGPLDVMTKAEKFWKDDDQVVGLVTFKRYAEEDEEPGVNIYWYPITEED